ncbi:MAG: HDOD domain-containing protein [Pseudomonadota bacterium]
MSDNETTEATSQKTKPPETKKEIIQEIISRFKKEEIDLPSAPQISIKFREISNKEVKIQEIADLLKQDVAITSKLIGVANSAYYRGFSEIKTLAQAVSRLGLTTTKQYVEAICNRSLYTTNNKKFLEFVEKLWEHSLSCAYASQIISEILKLRLPDDAFTLGLLHDIGRLLLLQIFGELEGRGQLGEEFSEIDMFKDIDEYHGRFGAALLKRWEFSKRYIQIALYHDNLEPAPTVSEELLVVNLANLLVKSMGSDQDQQAEIDVEGATSTRQLELDSKMIAEVKDKVKNLMDEMKEIFA